MNATLNQLTRLTIIYKLMKTKISQQQLVLVDIEKSAFTALYENQEICVLKNYKELCVVSLPVATIAKGGLSSVIDLRVINHVRSNTIFLFLFFYTHTHPHQTQFQTPIFSPSKTFSHVVVKNTQRAG